MNLLDEYSANIAEKIFKEDCGKWYCIPCKFAKWFIKHEILKDLQSLDYPR